MNDPVDNPAHYNQNGIEVIEVIETYAKKDFRLANVIKYVCRCEYKGKKLQDLEKAQWYLDRVIDELHEAREAFDGIDRGVSDWTLDDIEPPTGLTRDEVAEQFEEDLLGGKWRTGYTSREVEVFFEGYDCRKQEEAEEAVTAVPKGVDLHLPFDGRVAGQCDTPIYNDYYNYNGDEVIHQCANPACRCDITRSMLHVTGSAGKPYCCTLCHQLCTTPAIECCYECQEYLPDTKPCYDRHYTEAYELYPDGRYRCDDCFDSNLCNPEDA
jgi:hypothetical protein